MTGDFYNLNYCPLTSNLGQPLYLQFKWSSLSLRERSNILEITQFSLQVFLGFTFGKFLMVFST